jgi:CubicO group peptidase (beta-lactamase class C family)
MGLDPAAVRAAVTYATARGARSVRVYRRGCLVAEGGTEPWAAARPLAAFSMTKSVVSLAVGRADALGLLDVDAPIGPARRAAGYRVDAAKSALTPRHFLNQTSISSEKRCVLNTKLPSPRVLMFLVCPTSVNWR